jgi:maleate cis-trans isomerase
MSARVGLIVPSSNTVAEVDFYRELDGDATVHTARMHLDEVTPEEEAVMLDDHLPGALSVSPARDRMWSYSPARARELFEATPTSRSW